MKKTKYQIFDYYFEVPSLDNNRSLRVKICQKAFLSFLGLKKSELRKKIQINRSNCEDNRGKHDSRYRNSFELPLILK
jgi:hypothetical protein